MFVATITRLLFSKRTEQDFNVKRAWHSQNMLLTMIHSQVFRIITCYREGTSLRL